MSEIQSWKENTKAREQQAREAIADCALEGKMEQVLAITQALAPLAPALERLLRARKEWQQTVDALDALTDASHTKSPASRLKITLHWNKAGKQLPSQVIDERKASDSLALLLERIVRVLGPSCLASLAAIRVGTAGLVSRQPLREFLNPSTGEPYSHRAIGSTGWHVHTNTSTESKIDHIRQIASILGLPPGTIEVQKVQK